MIFLQVSPDGATQQILDVGAVGAVALLALAGFWMAWRRIDAITDRFLSHLQAMANERAALAGQQMESTLAIANSLQRLERTMDTHDQGAIKRNEQVVKKLEDMAHDLSVRRT